jgi:hypothetical protein
MKKQILKAIVNDMRLAGIFDIPANIAMEHDKIDSCELLNKLFDSNNSDVTSAILNTENFNESNIANEMNELFANFGSGKAPDLSAIETIRTAEAPKTQTKVKKQIIDPRNTPKTTIDKDFAFEPSKKETPAKKIVNFIEQDYIEVKSVANSKFVILLPYKNEEELKNYADFTLLENILKTVNSSYAQNSIVFIDDSFKKATHGDAKLIQLLAYELENALKLENSKFILCFGGDCLSLVSPEEMTIRQAAEKIINIKEDKKLLANYSLSAMLNTPKYKSSMWANLLLINKL